VTGMALMPAVLPMRNAVQPYDWGSSTTLARMQGRHPSGGPEAELWMGAHPAAPSAVLDGGAERRLDDLVAEQPADLLGPDVMAAFGARLPYLLKVLAIARPLSLQVHPGPERAREGYESEAEVRGEHRYVDPFAKPEMLYALDPVDALCGFRPAAEALRLLGLVDGPRAAAVAAPLVGHERDETACLEDAFRVLVTWPDDDRPAFAAEIAREARRLLWSAGGHGLGALAAHDRRALMWVSRLAQQHPKDPLVVAPLLLDLVLLRPGETLFVPAGAPHAYLHGTGVEIMGNSDNVLRAGLTHKPVAVEELLHVVDGRSRPVRDVPAVRLSGHEVAWRPGVREFQLTRLSVSAASAALPVDALPVDALPVDALPVHPAPGPQVLLCTAGAVSVRCPRAEVTLTPGTSAFAPAGTGPLTVAGSGEVFRAAVGLA
jgi:mannose-6-phosphate isomerase